MTKRVFLGGTCNSSQWRQNLIKLLKIDYFDPVVDDWNEEAQQREREERQTCDFCLYVITPLMTGSYAIAEAVDDSNKRPEKTVFCVLEVDYDRTQIYLDDPDAEPTITACSFMPSQLRSLKQIGRVVVDNGGRFYTSLQEVADFLNKFE